MDNELIFISTAARLLGMHPQTLRKYERLGLVRPAPTIGSMRLYSRDEIERLRFIKRLVDDMGINLAGVQQLLEIAEVMRRIRPLMREDMLARVLHGGRISLSVGVVAMLIACRSGSSKRSSKQVVIAVPGSCNRNCSSFLLSRSQIYLRVHSGIWK